MDEKDFRDFLKKLGKKNHVIDGLVGQVTRFDEFLRSQRGRDLDSAMEQDILDYAALLDGKVPGSAGKGVRGLALYFRHAGKESLSKAASSLREQAVVVKRRPFRLADFPGIPAEATRALQDAGIRTCEQMLEAGNDPQARRELAEKTGVAPEIVLELVSLSDLARLSGVKAIRARLYREAGVDSVEKLAAFEPEQLLHLATGFIQRTGFPGTPPLPKEVRSTIAAARGLPKVVEY